ncbi:MAG: hypothetical protein HY593_00350 [Candidatus Omnitrophica bacterium]|nr:hypothetical protein [Candidatus Omnitrophota bacterium]
MGAVLWWVGWIVLTLLSFFVSCYFWTGFIAKHVGTMTKPGAPVLWVAAVFGTWLLFLLPLIIVMYRKVDKAYEDARMAREKALGEKKGERREYRSVFVERSKRILNGELIRKLKKFPETVRRGHLVTVILRDGRRVEHVFVRDKKEVTGIYGARDLSFQMDDILDVELVGAAEWPSFQSEEWLRLDGEGQNE